MCVRPLVVGISGASCSGKTTLAFSLLGAFGTSQQLPPKPEELFTSYIPRAVVHLDRYFKPVKEMEKTWVARRKVANWELASSLRWDEFLAALHREIQRHTHLCPPCAEQKQHRSPSAQRISGSSSSSMFSSSIEFKRRLVLVEGFLLFANQDTMSLIDKHVFITIEKDVARRRRIENTSTPGWYFDHVVWPSYLKLSQQITQTLKNVVVIDGQTQKEEMMQAVVDFIEDRTVDDALPRSKLKHMLQELQPGLLSWF